MKDRDDIIRAAQKYKVKGQINDAIAEYLKIIPYSSDGNIHNTIGDLYLKKESTDEAIKYFREAAVIFNKDESHAKAIALYHKILTINPDLQDVVIELAELNAEKGFIKQAIEGLTSAAEAFYSKGLPMKALGVYKKTLSICPSDTELKIKIADLHLETSHTDRAVSMYLAIAMEYEANAESVKAEDMYKKVLSLTPDNIESLTHLSRLAEDDQDIELAFEYMSKAAAIAPNNSEIMSDYSNLAAKTNKDISEYLVQNQNGPDHNASQNIQIPDAVNNSSKTGTHKPLDLSSENIKTHNINSSKAISTSTSPLPITSTGSGSEEAGFTVPADTGETRVEKSGIWDDINNEDKNNKSVIDSIHEKTSKAGTDNETAEAVYDQTTEGYAFKVPDHEKTESDSRRLKRRVKGNRLHAALILFFTIVTAISFFAAYKFIKKTQTVDIETPVHIVPQEPNTVTDAKTGEGFSATGKTPAQNKVKEQVKTRTEPIKKVDNIKADNQGDLNLPVRLTEPDINEGKTITDSTDQINLIEEESNLTDIQKDGINSTVNPDSEIALENNNTTIDDEKLTATETADTTHQKENNNKQEEAIISFNELFDNNDNSWDIIQTSAAYVRMLDGKYYIRNRRESGAYIILNGPDLSTDNNFEIKADLNSIDNSGDHSYGLVFGAKDKEDFFVFQMLAEDKYSIRKYFRGVSLELAGGEINSNQKSQNNFNVLKINSKENKLSFFINETYVDEVSDISFFNRKAGFFINGKTEIIVDKILIHQKPR